MLFETIVLGLAVEVDGARAVEEASLVKAIELGPAVEGDGTETEDDESVEYNIRSHIIKLSTKWQLLD